MTGISVNHVDAAHVRVPAPQVGAAVVVTRYRKEQAIVMHPDDFHRLSALEASLDEIAPPIEMTVRAASAHADESYAQGPIEDADELRAFLGL